MSEVPGELENRSTSSTEKILDATKQKPYPSFFEIMGASTVPDINALLDNLVDITKRASWDELMNTGIQVTAKHSDAFALRRDCTRRYASRYALFRKGYDSKLLQTTILTGKYKVNGKQ